MDITEEVLAYYNRGEEKDRLVSGRNVLEAERTKEIILRYIGQERIQILDIGGGAGYYSLWLAGLGHAVYLVEPSPTLIKAARDKAKKQKIALTSISEGEARKLEFNDNFFDMVLMLGPLYHLGERRERLDALYEARRVLIPGGHLICAAISRFASVLDGFFSNFIEDPAFLEIMTEDLIDGHHHNPTDNPLYFTEAYFHNPEDLKEEVRQGGFRLEALLAVEGFGWLLPNLEKRWKDERFRALLLDKLRAVESEFSCIGTSAHLLAVGKKM